MNIIGCDYHPSFQQIAWVNTETGEMQERKLTHGDGEAERFYRQLQGPVRVGLESTGNCHWFVDLLTEMGHEVWIGDAARISAKQVRQQRTDRRDAAHILELLVKDDFPRIWMPSRQERDQRQLLIHRYKLVTLRVRVKNELQHLALNQGMQKGRSLWSKAGQKLLLALPLQFWAGTRRKNLLELLKQMDQQIAMLDQAVKKAAEENEKARLLMTQPGVGPITSLAFLLTLGDVTRFRRGKQVASYLGLIPREYSSGGKQRLGGISKQGNRFMRMLLVEAAQAAVRHDPGFRSEYLHRCHHKPKAVAKVATARKLAIRLYWMLRTNTPYPEVVRIESSPRVPLAG
ncbi:MAG TPA: IS110 family transposase [Candidatus Angelobacter sp.]|nr:IS110 family transposase [Candidatus Angelobacter sp.]